VAEPARSYWKAKPSVEHWISFGLGIEREGLSFFSSGYEMVYITQKE